MQINFKILDGGEEDLKRGDILSFCASDLVLSIKDGQRNLSLTTGFHTTFLLNLIEELIDLYKNKKDFTIDIIGNGTEYTFGFNTSRYIRITGIDHIEEKFIAKIDFEHDSFYLSIKKFFNNYLNYVNKINPAINKYQGYLPLVENVKKFSLLEKELGLY